MHVPLPPPQKKKHVLFPKLEISAFFVYEKT